MKLVAGPPAFTLGKRVFSGSGGQAAIQQAVVSKGADPRRSVPAANRFDPVKPFRHEVVGTDHELKYALA